MLCWIADLAPPAQSRSGAKLECMNDQVVIRTPVPTVEQTARRLGLSRKDVEAVYEILVKNGAKLAPLAPWRKRRSRAKRNSAEK